MASISFTISELFTASTKARIYEAALTVASALGLPVTTWRAGDPTRSVYHVISEELESRDTAASSYAAAGFLDSASGDWLTILADQVFNVQREEATAASADVTLKNTGGGVYSWDAGDIVFRSTANNKTYHNTTAGTLSVLNETTVVGFVADEAGSDSALDADDLDEIVTSLAGVIILTSSAATAKDSEDDETLRQRCRDSTGALSPNGPADAYRYVATSSSLTGDTETTRVYVDADSVAGTVAVVCAGDSGAVSGTAVTAVENALATYATPLCITVNVSAATESAQDITLAVVLKSSLGVSEAEAEAAITTALEDMIAAYPVGGVGNKFYRDAIRGAAFAVYGAADTVSMTVTLPASDPTIADTEVVTPGTISVSVSFI